MAADWTFLPEDPYKIKPRVERPLINEIEDMSEIRATRGLTIGGTYTESYTFSGNEMQTALAFFASKLLTTSFTKLSYDPRDVAWDPDNPTISTGPLETVRFVREPTVSFSGPDKFTVKFTFKILSNE